MYQILFSISLCIMTELNIGAHCSQEDCKQLDFLPIHCEHCDRIFCKIHSSITAHNCPISSSTYQCHQASSQSRSDDANDKICDYHLCNQRQLVLLSCDGCYGNFCTSHKQKEVHQCSGLAQSVRQWDKIQTVKTVDRTALNAISHTIIPTKTNDTLSVKPLSDRARATKAKLILLKTKMEALPGGQRARELPESERFVIRLSVMPEVLSTNNMISVYFGKRWPLGCILDYGCEHFHLPRDKKYGLIRLSDELDEYFTTTECSQHQKDIVSNSLLDLSSSLKQHVVDNCFVEGQLLQIVCLPQT
uniref:Putative zinc finger protein n=1 Tax=Schistosoma mansoni TaxID=6183 RepID=A0A5K4ENM1_SCHMA